MCDLSVLTGEERGSNIRRRFVGAALRRSREHVGYGLTEAAKILECDRSKISRIESGQRGIRPKELRELLTEYGISGAELVTLTAIADPLTAGHGWWRNYADIVPANCQNLMMLEDLASEIMIHDGQQIPDLLQTLDYARAIAESELDIPAPGMLDRLAEMSITRRQVIINERRTAVTAVIGEASLRQQVGNIDIMRKQVQWLAEITNTCPWVTIRVLPFQAGAHPKRTGPMSILRFTEAPSLGIVHLSGPNGGVCLIDQNALADYTRAFTQLQVSALSSNQSAALISEMAGVNA